MHPNIDGSDGITLIEHTQGWLSHVTVISREYQDVSHLRDNMVLYHKRETSKMLKLATH